MIIVFPISKNPSKLEQAISTDSSQARINSSILGRLHGLSCVDARIEYLEFLQHVVISHSSYNVDQSSKASDRVAASTVLQVRDMFEGSYSRWILENLWAFSHWCLICATNEIDDAFLGGDCTMKWGNNKINFQRNNIPLNWIIVFQISNFNHMQVSFGDFKKVQKRFPWSEVTGILNQESVLI